MFGLPLTTRKARPEDSTLVARLVQAAGARPLYGDVVVATAGGEPVAAISLADGRAVGDDEAAELLRTLRAA